MNEQEEKMKNKSYGGSMRLGSYLCRLKAGSMARKLYGESAIEERHRHRYEFNPDYRKSFEAKGMMISGESPDGTLAEIVELKKHPFFMGTQAHPEFLSRPFKPHPLFLGFVKAASKK
jgi:CTP synthase